MTKELQDETMKEDSIKNERISIEEAIKIMEHWIEYEKNNKEKINRADELINIQETILSDYKRVLKENEELLQEKIDNQKINLLAQNFMLDYQKGYEDGKANRGSAVQIIIDNQQYHIFRKQIEKYKEHIEKLQKENEELKDRIREHTMLISPYYVKENYIPIQKVKEMRDELDRTKAEYMEWQKQELEQKDKIIEQMTYYIMNLDIDEDICKKVNCDTNSGELDCKDCIKQYFINKAKEIR